MGPDPAYLDGPGGRPVLAGVQSHWLSDTAMNEGALGRLFHSRNARATLFLAEADFCYQGYGSGAGRLPFLAP
ncbi:hypothetical protein METHP14_560006 [Pseudomonas sp. P14-2025]